MDQGEIATKQKGRTSVYTNTQTFANKNPRNIQQKTNQNKKYNKACITIPTEDNTEEEERLLKERNIGEEDLKN